MERFVAPGRPFAFGPAVLLTGRGVNRGLATIFVQLRRMASLFVPPAESDRWRTEAVAGMSLKWADHYLDGPEPKDLGSMPILADALQEAGCEEWRIRLAREWNGFAPGVWPVIRPLPPENLLD